VELIETGEGCRFPAIFPQEEALAFLPIVKFPESVLLEACEPVDSFDDDLKRLAADMVETMHGSAGIGLAANQVADRRRLMVLDTSGGADPDEILVVCNPETLEESGSQTDEEGCLSFPGLVAIIERPEWIRIRYQDLDGKVIETEAEGLLARVWCHELDHLNGKTLLDRVSSLKRSLLKREIKKRVAAGEWA
jgi:peptide deformylase